MPRDGVLIGLVFAHGDEGFSHDSDGPRRFASAVEDAGFDYLTVPDHVLGVSPARGEVMQPRATLTEPFREVFVHLGFLAAVTSRLELMPCVLVLPQRQAAVVAKQAAEIDVLTGGRLRLGVGIGWSSAEAAALGTDFATRGARFDEQLQVMRALWTSESVTYRGVFHTLVGVGIAPSPVQRPIPLWIGGGPSRVSPRPHKRVFRRIATQADGWVASPSLAPAEVAAIRAQLFRYADEAGRDPHALGVQASLQFGTGLSDNDVRRGLDELRRAGATHVTFDLRHGHRTLTEHIDLAGALGDLVAAG